MTTTERLIRLLLSVGIVCGVVSSVDSTFGACNSASGVQFTGVLNVSPRPQNTTITGGYVPDASLLANTLLGWFNLGSINAQDVTVITTAYDVCCPSVIAEPNYGNWKLILNQVEGNATLSPTKGSAVLPDFASKVLGAAGNAIPSTIITQVQTAINSLTVTYVGFTVSWSGNFYNPEIDEDDCHGCALNTRWSAVSGPGGGEQWSFVGTAGSYNNSAWASGTVFAVVATLIDANANIQYTSGVVGGNALKWKTTQTYIRTEWQFGNSDPGEWDWVTADSGTTTVVDQHPFCQVHNPASP